MATLVWTADEEPTVAVARFVAELAWSDAGEDISGPAVAQVCGEAESLLSLGRFVDLVDLLLTSADAVLSKASDKDIECVFGVVSNFVAKAESVEQSEAMANQIASKLLANPSEKPALKLKLLLVLYNLLPGSAGVRFSLFLRALRLASAGRVPELMGPAVRRIPVLLPEWRVGRLQQRDLFLSVSSLLKDSKGGLKESNAYLVKFLATFSEGDDVSAPEVKQAAVRAALDFIKSPDSFQSDLLDMAAVRALKGDAEHGLVFELLSTFLVGRLSDFRAFHSQHPSFLQSLGLSKEESEVKMRLLSLAALAADAAASAPGGPAELRYSLIRDTLQISEDEVESWVVRAIAAKIIAARMDQLRKVVIVTKKTLRVFGPGEWKELRSKLAQWRENISNVSRIINTTKGTSSVGPQAAQPTTAAY